MSEATVEPVAGPSRARTYACPDCGAQFARKEYIARHRQLKHLGARPFSCTDCSASFGRTDLLKRHRKTCAAVVTTAKRSGAAVPAPVGVDHLDLSHLSTNPRGRAARTSLGINKSATLSPISDAIPTLSSNISPSAHSAQSSPDFTSVDRCDGASSTSSYASFTSEIATLSQIEKAFGENLSSSKHPSSGQQTANTRDSSLITRHSGDDGSRQLGISALEAGFKYEPTFLEEWLFEPQYLHEAPDPKFFLPKEKFFKKYYNSPWYTPPLAILSRYAESATKSFLPAMPVVHSGTLHLPTVETHTAFALTVIGGAYDYLGQAFSDEMLAQKRVQLMKGSSMPGLTDLERFAFLQSLLLYQLLGLFHRQEHQRRQSHLFHGSVVMMMRQISVMRMIKEAVLPEIHFGLEGSELNNVWRQWVHLETLRRVVFIIYLCDLETATQLQSNPLMAFAELSIDLPACNRLWDASNATEWLGMYLCPSTPKSLAFLDALRAVLRQSTTTISSPDAKLLKSLQSLDGFPLFVLTRTLSFLNHLAANNESNYDMLRVELLVQQMRVSGSASDDKTSQQRIRDGRALLRDLIGEVECARGEKWWLDVAPQIDEAMLSDFKAELPESLRE